MLDDTCIVQTNQGSSGTALTTSFNATLGSATTAGNCLWLVLCNADANRACFPTDATFLALGSLSNVSPIPTVNTLVRNTAGGETTFAVTVDGVGDRVVWFIAELDGLASMGTGYDPDGTFLGFPTNVPIGKDGPVGSGGVLFGGTACNTSNSGTANANGDDFILAVGCGEKTAAGVVPTLTSCVDTTAGQPGTWARMGSTVATTHASGINVRLDVFRKYTGGVAHLLDATFTWSATVQGGAALIGGVRAEAVQPQQTPGRAATNSMM